MKLALAATAVHDALAPAGPQAAHIAELWWILVAACVVVFVAVLAALGWAVWRAPRADAGTPPQVELVAHIERKAGRRVAWALAVSSVLLVALLVASIATDRAMAKLSLTDAVAVHITAHQWWWEVTYDDALPERVFATANEIYVPVGRPVVATLESVDVIHSFWVPSLAGKKDLIPGRTSTIEFRADAAGRYRGPCAEFCGWQHANMFLEVVAVPPADFEAWADAQRKPAADPSDAMAKRGRELFLTGSCMMCHAILGTTANARKAPDLTHVASRERLAAGRIANTPSELAAWIADPQRIKPGANMPAHPISGDDLQALVAYLGTLK
jgi:cytochrome c oxidase subunit 2